MINWDNVWTLVVAFVICLVIYYVEEAVGCYSGGRRRH